MSTSTLRRICRFCGVEFEYKRRRVYGGHPRGYCSDECRKAAKRKRLREYAANNREHVRETQNRNNALRKARDPEGYAQRLRDNQARYRERHPDRVNAIAISRRKGMKGMVCVRCGSDENVIQHHFDYSQPEKWLPLCRSCNTSTNAITLHELLPWVPQTPYL